MVATFNWQHFMWRTAGIEGQRKVAEADLAPARYLATFVGAKDDDVLCYFILVVALMLLHTAAVVGLLGFHRA